MRLRHVFGLASILLPLVPVAAGGLDGIVAPDAQVRLLGTGMAFTEGPVWIPARNMLVFSDIPNAVQMQWTEAGGVEKFRAIEQSNGNLLDLQGRLLSCQHGGRNVIRTEADGKITVLADKFEGKKFNSPNDLAVRADGSIWFTDPGYGLRGRPAEVPGRWVYRLDPESGAVRVVYKGFDMPNGIAFSPDEKMLYIADTGKVGVVRAFKVPEKGMLGDPVFEIDVRCDGMCVDTKGNLYTTSKGGIHVFDKEGKKLGVIETPEQPANVCFGGTNNDTLFITARKSLYMVKTLAVGSKPAGAKMEDFSKAVYEVRPIGRVHNKKGAPAQLEVFEQFREGLDGLDQCSHVTVLWWFHKNDTPEKRKVLSVHPCGHKENPLTGVFATHSPMRPNLIAHTVCKVLSVKDGIVTIDAIDAFDDTPILDLKSAGSRKIKLKGRPPPVR